MNCADNSISLTAPEINCLDDSMKQNAPEIRHVTLIESTRNNVSGRLQVVDQYPKSIGLIIPTNWQPPRSGAQAIPNHINRQRSEVLLTIPRNKWSSKSVAWTIPINRQSPKSIVWKNPISGQSPKSICLDNPQFMGNRRNQLSEQLQLIYSRQNYLSRQFKLEHGLLNQLQTPQTIEVGSAQGVTKRIYVRHSFSVVFLSCCVFR